MEIVQLVKTFFEDLEPESICSMECLTCTNYVPDMFTDTKLEDNLSNPQSGLQICDDYESACRFKSLSITLNPAMGGKMWHGALRGSQLV